MSRNSKSYSRIAETPQRMKIEQQKNINLQSFPLHEEKHPVVVKQSQEISLHSRPLKLATANEAAVVVEDVVLLRTMKMRMRVTARKSGRRKKMMETIMKKKKKKRRR